MIMPITGINHSYRHIKGTARCVISHNALQWRHIKDAARCVMSHNALQCMEARQTPPELAVVGAY